MTTTISRCRRGFLSGLLLVAFLVLWTGQAMAIPVMYTNRAAFDAAGESSTLLTLDTPSQTVVDPSRSEYRATYESLMTFTFDQQGGVGVGIIPGAVVMGTTGLSSSAEVLPPVTAFGFDVEPGFNSHVLFMGNTYPLSGLNFLGFVATSPFTAQIESIPSPPDPSSSAFVIDNVAFKTQAIPEPATWWLVFAGSLVVVLARWRIFGLAR